MGLNPGYLFKCFEFVSVKTCDEHLFLFLAWISRWVIDSGNTQHDHPYTRIGGQISHHKQGGT